MCLLKVKVRTRQEEQTYSEIAVVEISNGVLKLYSLLFEKVLEVPLSNIRKMVLNSVDANLLIDLD